MISSLTVKLEDICNITIRRHLPTGYSRNPLTNNIFQIAMTFGSSSYIFSITIYMTELYFNNAFIISYDVLTDFDVTVL